MSHPAEIDLIQKIADVKEQISVGSQYTHYKSADKTYTVIEIGITEADDSLCVIYRANYGAQLTFTRPVKSWLETVQVEGSAIPRFTLISAEQ